MELIENRFNELMRAFHSVENKEFRSSLDEFIEEFGRDELYKNYKRQIDYFEAELLYESKAYQKALAIYNVLYETEETGHKNLYAQKVAAVLIELGREEEAVSLIEDLLGNQTHFSNSLDLLYWLVANVTISEKRLDRHRETIDAIVVGLGVKIPHTIVSSIEKLVYLKEQRKEASWRYSDLLFKLNGLPEKEKETLVDNFVSQEEVRYFSEMAEKIVRN